ncbi:MAG: XrtN system VIT domain-containing protein, partial [Saprospiraceae bacterium]
MKALLQVIRDDSTLRFGLVSLLLSFLLFSFTANVYDTNLGVFRDSFFANYGFTVVYFIVVLVNNKSDFGGYFKFKSFARNVVLLQLFNISAYALNRSITVFDLSVNWVVAFLLISNIVMLLAALGFSFRRQKLNHLMLAIANLGVLFHFYQSIYVLYLYPFAMAGFWFFGIPLHTFVPLLMLIAFIKIVRRYLRKGHHYLPTTLSTWLLAIIFISYFCIRFDGVTSAMDATFHQQNKPYQDDDLPAWVLASQQLKKDWITKRALECGISYSSQKRIFSGIGNVRLNDRVKHDPLVVIASFCTTGTQFQNKDRIKILRSLYDERHTTERKLWSGNNLSTTDIVTNVQLFPEYRIAYTEKIFKIHNNIISQWRGNRQEALYTFYLPEGSVVTSAALWVEGEERPAYLTTKGKAEKAYKRIVGVERRDPLLLHWQEGNRVTVRVFPCTPKEDRQFKIGVTTPLQKSGDQLIYENIDFEGPYWQTAEESITVVSEGELTNIDTPFSFQEDGLNYTYSGPYNSRWTLSFDAPAISNNTFTFNEKSYQLKEYDHKLEAFDPTHIYLDINAGWSKSELKKIWEATKGKEVFTFFNNNMIKVTEKNRKKLFKRQCNSNFTLFPFHKINSEENNLIISKYNQLTPTLSDIKKSTFMEKTSDYFSNSNVPTKVFNLSESISPYLKTLKELRSIEIVNGDVNELLELLNQKQFHKNKEDQNTIVNQYASF